MQLSRVKDEFLFTIESTGILSPEELFKEALKVFADCLCTPLIYNTKPLIFQVLTDKCATVAAALQGGGE